MLLSRSGDVAGMKSSEAKGQLGPCLRRAERQEGAAQGSPSVIRSLTCALPSAWADISFTSYHSFLKCDIPASLFIVLQFSSSLKPLQVPTEVSSEELVHRIKQKWPYPLEENEIKVKALSSPRLMALPPDLWAGRKKPFCTPLHFTQTSHACSARGNNHPICLWKVSVCPSSDWLISTCRCCMCAGHLYQGPPEMVTQAPPLRIHHSNFPWSLFYNFPENSCVIHWWLASIELLQLILTRDVKFKKRTQERNLLVHRYSLVNKMSWRK